MKRKIDRLVATIRRLRKGRKNTSRAGNPRYNFRGTGYAETTKPQHYGPGQNLRNIEIYFEAFNHSYFNINSLFSASVEHQTMCTLFNYYKILNLMIIFPPSMAQQSSSYFYVQLNWNDQDDTNIQQEDNSKMVPVYRTRKYELKFVPINMPLLLGTTNSPVVLNLVNFMRTSDNIVIPGVFNFDAPNDFTARAKIVARVEYRGSKVPNSTGLKALADKLEKAELTRPKFERKEIKLGEENKIGEENEFTELK